MNGMPVFSGHDIFWPDIRDMDNTIERTSLNPGPTITIRGTRGQAYKVRRIRPGDRYGRDDCQVNNTSDEMVEFLDLSKADRLNPNGSFTGGRYFAHTLVKDRLALQSRGLCLDCGFAREQSISGPMAGKVIDWLRGRL